MILPGDAWVARLWRTHPRCGDEPDSSMLGVLDQCEQLVLLDQAMRNMARRAMNAGLVFIPDGITAYADDADVTVADAIAKSALQAVESEAALSTVTPKVVTGPLELGKEIKFIPLTQPTDPNLAAAAQKLLERILQGIDIPKDVVKGLGRRQVRQRHRHRRQPVPGTHRTVDPADRRHAHRGLPAPPADEGAR